MRVQRSGECRNSPKNAFVETLAIDLLSGNHLGDRAADAATMPSIPAGITAIRIVHAISHGRVGAANGSFRAGGDDVPFAIVIEFTTTKAMSVGTVELYLGAHRGG